MQGKRKVIAAMFYLSLCFCYSWMALEKGIDGYTVAAVCTAWASGLATFMWGNVKANGK